MTRAKRRETGKWSEEELRHLIESAGHVPKETICRKLNRSPEDVEHRALATAYKGMTSERLWEAYREEFAGQQMAHFPESVAKTNIRHKKRKQVGRRIASELRIYWYPTGGSSLTPGTAVYLLERGFGIVLELST